MLYAALKTLHLLSIIVWVGGMAYTLFFLRPALIVLDPPLRVRLMHDVLRRFFAAVLVSIAIVLVSGIWMMLIFSGGQADTPAGVDVSMPWNWMVMATLGVVMAAIFGHIRYVLFKRLRLAVLDQKWVTGGAALASIRSWVSINLVIGLVIVIVVGMGAVAW